MSRPPISAVIFDFDSTLLDTEMPIFESWGEVFERHGQRLELEDWEVSLGTSGAFDPFALMEELTARPVDRVGLRQELRPHIRRRIAAKPLRAGVAATIEEAQDLGLDTAVASLSSGDWIEHWLDHHGIRDSFDSLVSRDRVERVKPAPDLFLLAAAELGVEPTACLVFEDSPNGIRAARAAGMRCVAVPNRLTRRLELPAADLVLRSFADSTISEILSRLDQRPVVG